MLYRIGVFQRRRSRYSDKMIAMLRTSVVCEKLTVGNGDAGEQKRRRCAPGLVEGRGTPPSGPACMTAARGRDQSPQKLEPFSPAFDIETMSTPLITRVTTDIVWRFGRYIHTQYCSVWIQYEFHGEYFVLCTYGVQPIGRRNVHLLVPDLPLPWCRTVLLAL